MQKIDVSFCELDGKVSFRIPFQGAEISLHVGIVR